MKQSLATLSLAAALCSLTQAQTWSDDFESYTAGSALEGQGGWAGWDGANTSFTVVSDTQASSGTRSIQPNPGADTVHEFTTATAGTWVFEASVYVPATFTSTLDLLLMNAYQDFGPYEWGAWLVFDGPSGMVSCNCGGFGASQQAIPFDRWVPIRKVIDLDGDLAEIWFDGSMIASYTWTTGYDGQQTHGVPGVDAIDIYATGAGPGLYLDDLRLYEMTSTLGTNYCDPAVANSTGVPGAISALGSRIAATNDVTLTASDLPANAFGFFIAGQTQGFVPNPAGSAGNLCLGGAIGRYVGPGQIMNSGGNGEFSLTLDLTNTPQPNGFVSVMGGETWNYQTWYRDVVGGTAGSNFTNGLSIAFI